MPAVASVVQVEVAESVVQASPRDDVRLEDSAEDSTVERLRSLAPPALLTMDNRCRAEVPVQSGSDESR